MTQTDIDSGRLIVVVGVAPVKPAEFVIVRIGLWTAHGRQLMHKRKEEVKTMATGDRRDPYRVI